MNPEPSINRQSIVPAFLWDKDTGPLGKSRSIPKWLPLLVGLVLAVPLASLIANEAWYLAVVVALAVPAIVLLSRCPFVAVMAWLLLLPYFLSTPTVAERAMYWVLHRAMIPGALGLAIVSGWLGARSSRKIRLAGAEMAMLIFLGLAVVNVLLWSQDQTQGLITLYDRVFVPFCAYYLIRATSPGEKDLKRLLWVALVTLVSQCAISLLTWFAPQTLPAQLLHRTLGARTVGSLGNTAVYTSTLLFLTLLLYQYAMDARSKLVRYTIFGSFALAIFCVFISFSRASWLGCSMVLLGLVFLYPRTTLRLLIILGVTACALGASLFADEVAWAYERLSSEAAQRSVQNRVLVTNALVGMIRAKPLFGWGYGDHQLYSPQFMTSVGDIAVARYYSIGSHNTYLTIMAELGIPALFPYLWPALWWLIHSMKVRRRLPLEGFVGRR
ncbi:MAG: O-antigen ligase family protein, partial [Anaerolineae bacterium]|nr:O-antigen ligase family protein [Anaerolineae bacterium]